MENALTKNKLIDTPLYKEEEYDLINRWQKYNDEKSLLRIISAYKRLVNSIVRKYLSYGLSKEDLVQEGIIGIVIALKKLQEVS